MVWKATSLGNVPKKPKQSHATSAVKKAILCVIYFSLFDQALNPPPFTSPAIAPITQLVEAIPIVEEEVAEALSAISAAKWDTLRVRALSRLGVVVVVDMVEAIMERLVVVHRRLGMAPSFN